MFVFTIKENGPGLSLLVTRAMLALSALTALLYRGEQYAVINILAAAFLFTLAIVVKVLVVRIGVNRFLLICAAAVFLLIATRSVAFALILILYGYLVKYLDQVSRIEVSGKGVAIKKLFGGPVHEWQEFTNIVLKDYVLTMDFKDNTLLQVNIDEKTPVDENSFNVFCKGFI